MTIGIIGAMAEEVQLLLEKINIEKKKTKANMQFHLGTIKGKKVVVVVSGIGKVNAAICTQILIDDFSVDKVINVGVAGGLGENIYPGDIVIGENLVQHDMDTSAFGDEIGQVPRLDTYAFKAEEELVGIAVEMCMQIKEHNHFIGRIVTGDQFIAETEKAVWLNNKFGALACEMEGASIAQVCYLNQVPFVVIRSISDNGVIGAHMDYEKFKPIAIENSTKILQSILEKI